MPSVQLGASYSLRYEQSTGAVLPNDRREAQGATGRASWSLVAPWHGGTVRHRPRRRHRLLTGHGAGVSLALCERKRLRCVLLCATAWLVYLSTTNIHSSRPILLAFARDTFVPDSRPSDHRSPSWAGPAGLTRTTYSLCPTPNTLFCNPTQLLYSHQPLIV